MNVRDMEESDKIRNHKMIEKEPNMHEYMKHRETDEDT